MHVTRNIHLSHRCADTQLNISWQNASTSAQLFELEHTKLSITAAPIFLGLLLLEYIRHQENGKSLSAHRFQSSILLPISFHLITDKALPWPSRGLQGLYLSLGGR